jgi:hypothetical protein
VDARAGEGGGAVRVRLDGRTKAGRAAKREREEAIAAEWKMVRDRAAACSICRNLPDTIFADYIRDPNADPPAAVGRLVDVRNLGYYGPWLVRCPECGTYYRHEHSCGYMEHDDGWDRLLDSEARALIPPDAGNRS